VNREELIEHLRNEIANRDERIGELENDASYYAARYEDVREELEALKASNLALQIHFDTMKAELEEMTPACRVCTECYCVGIHDDEYSKNDANCIVPRSLLERVIKYYEDGMSIYGECSEIRNILEGK